MSAPRFFVDGPVTTGATIALRPDDAHHASHVLRMRADAPIVVVAGGLAWDAVIGAADCETAHILRPSPDSGGDIGIDVTVLQALIKGAKFDDVVEKCVELGASRIVPMRCERSEADASGHKVERWRRIARAAAQQSRRNIVPAVDDVRSFAEALSAGGVPLLVASERAPKGSLAEALRANAGSTALAIAVGPEGSFTDAELAAAKEAGAAFVSLGPAILRTETAAAALLAAIASVRVW
ncbi:MAG TPA: RsmE family RNA methyltransferase [Candidatus Eremiobacteraceae bacterium]|jgi:16S rRNA (uracil1498-N3)-methyltransferase